MAMISFFSTGTGGGSGPVGYCISTSVQAVDQETGQRIPGEYIERDPPPIVMAGDPELTKQLIDSSDNQWKYSSGVIAFEKGDKPTEEQQRQCMEEFEKLAFAGLDHDQYNILWVKHEHKGNVELHFVIPRLELSTGNAYNPRPPGEAATAAYDALRDTWNLAHGWADPDDPERAKTVKISKSFEKPSLQNQATAKQEITDWLTQRIEDGLITDRAGIVSSLSEIGEITRIDGKKNGRDYIGIKPEGFKTAIRLQGVIYDSEFSSESIKEIAREDRSRPKADRKPNDDSVRSAREKLERAVSARQEYNHKRYCRNKTIIEDHKNNSKESSNNNSSDRVDSLHSNLSRLLGADAILCDDDIISIENNARESRKNQQSRRNDQQSEQNNRQPKDNIIDASNFEYKNSTGREQHNSNISEGNQVQHEKQFNNNEKDSVNDRVDRTEGRNRENQEAFDELRQCSERLRRCSERVLEFTTINRITFEAEKLEGRTESNERVQIKIHRLIPGDRTRNGSTVFTLPDMPTLLNYNVRKNVWNENSNERTIDNKPENRNVRIRREQGERDRKIAHEFRNEKHRKTRSFAIDQGYKRRVGQFGGEVQSTASVLAQNNVRETSHHIEFNDASRQSTIHELLDRLMHSIQRIIDYGIDRIRKSSFNVIQSSNDAIRSTLEEFSRSTEGSNNDSKQRIRSTLEEFSRSTEGSRHSVQSTLEESNRSIQDSNHRIKSISHQLNESIQGSRQRIKSTLEKFDRSTDGSRKVIHTAFEGSIKTNCEREQYVQSTLDGNFKSTEGSRQQNRRLEQRSNELKDSNRQLEQSTKDLGTSVIKLKNRIIVKAAISAARKKIRQNNEQQEEIKQSTSNQPSIQPEPPKRRGRGR